MASITTRAGKGSPLTNAEVDANFTNLNTELGTMLPKSGGTMTGAITFAAGQTWPTFNQSTTGNAATATTATNLSGGSVSATTGTFSGDTILSVGGGVPLNQIFRFNSANSGLGWGVTEISSNGHLVFQTRTGTGGWTTAVNFGSNGQITASNGFVGALTGNASTATALATGRTIAMTGDVTWTSAAFNGSANVTGAATLANSGVTAGSYGGNNSIPSVTVDAKGRVTAASTVTPSGTWGISVSGNAATATALQTARTINGVSFNGTANITVADATKLPLTGGTLTGAFNAPYLGVNNTTSTNGYGLSLYGGATAGQPTYGLMFQGTATFGTYGPVTADWATYFTMNNTAGRGWIFKTSTGTAGNVAAISTAGAATFASTVTAPTFSGALSGNATTATTLQTARSINGTSFNGSANITTANWGTARTLTIGNTGKSVNGSANVAWSVAEIGAESQHAFGVPRSNLGDPTVREMALFDAQFDNKTERHDIAQIFVETSTDNVTWTTFSVTDANKRTLVGGDSVFSGLTIPYNTPYFRIRLRATSYVYLNALYMYWSSSGHSSRVQIFKKHDSGSWTQHTSSTAAVSAWPGHLYLPFSTIPWHPSGTLGTHFHEIYVLFQPTWNATYPSNGIALYKMQWWGGYPAGKRNLYGTNEFGDAAFPAALSAVGAITQNGNQVLHAGNYTSYSPSLTGAGASGTWGISITGSSASTTGNAATATTLQTARTINGVSFNGSANITITAAANGGNSDTVDSLHAASFFRSDAANSVDARLASGDGRGLRFWDSDAYKIWMSASTNTTWGGRISGETTSDYNMYFSMESGTNRGFVFESGYATKLFAINPNGVRSAVTVTAPTFSGALSGNATTATTLATARSINGTSFNGSANITTANWGTARTLTIGATGKSVNGSANVSWTAAEMGVVPLSGNVVMTGALVMANNVAVAGRDSTGTNRNMVFIGADNYMNIVNGGNVTTRILNQAQTATLVTLSDTSGNFSASGNVTAYSDERLKKDWAPVSPDFVERLAKVKSGTYTRTDINVRQVGSSAQDWQALLPEAVQVASDERGTLSLAYGNAALVAAVELAKRVVRLEAALEKLIGD